MRASFGKDAGWTFDQASKGVWWMPWHQEAMKDVATCDKPRLVGSKRNRGSPNGETPSGEPRRSLAECIGQGGKPGELKHLSTPRKRKQTATPSVAASESGSAQTVRMPKAATVVRTGLWDVFSGLCRAPERLQICLLVEFLLDKRSHRG